MSFLKTGAALQAAAASMLELGQKEVTQHFAFLRQSAELSQKFFAKSLEATTGSGLVDVSLDYVTGVHKLATEVVYAQVTFAAEVARAGYQSLLELQAGPYQAQTSGKVETVASGGDVAEVRERAPEVVESVKVMMETTVAPAKSRRKSRPKKA
jgi:hypothetical protein